MCMCCVGCCILNRPQRRRTEVVTNVLMPQRLLWELDGNLAFGPPTVRQIRNPHNLLRDYREEAALYDQAGELPPSFDGFPWHAALAGSISLQEKGDMIRFRCWPSR